MFLFGEFRKTEAHRSIFVFLIFGTQSLLPFRMFSMSFVFISHCILLHFIFVIESDNMTLLEQKPVMKIDTEIT